MATEEQSLNRYYVVPWENTAQIQSTYHDIFTSPSAEDRRRALDTLTTWKYRMSSFYSVGLSATFSLLEVEVKSYDPKYSTQDLRVWYAYAFNRFLNFAHSLTMTQSSMFGAAKELGIHTFIVDIRHLCSHGTALPALDTFRRCSEACKKWLRLFYWDNLLREAKDVTNSDLDLVAGTAGLSKELVFLLTIYDFTAHQIWKRRKTIDEIEGEIVTETFTQYAKSLESDNLMLIRSQLLKDCAAILERDRGRLSATHIFCRELVQRMPHFFEEPAQNATTDVLEVTVVHQNFFHMIANAGIVGEVLRKLLTASVDSSLTPVIRAGAGYWAGQMLKTCSALRSIRSTQQKELSPEELLNLNWDSINTKSLDKAIERAFAALEMSRENSLIFGVSKRNAWEVKFSREFVVRQLKHTTAANKEAHLKLLQFVDPPLTEEVQNEFQDVINSFMDPMEAVKNVAKKKERVEMDVDYEIKDVEEDVKDEQDEDLGIWSTPDEGVAWEKCSIGSHLYHVVA